MDLQSIEAKIFGFHECKYSGNEEDASSYACYGLDGCMRFTKLLLSASRLNFFFRAKSSVSTFLLWWYGKTGLCLIISPCKNYKDFRNINTNNLICIKLPKLCN